MRRSIKHFLELEQVLLNIDLGVMGVVMMLLLAAGPAIALFLGMPMLSTFGFLGEADPEANFLGDEDGQIRIGDVHSGLIVALDDASRGEHGGR